ncbi:MAG: protein translocase subunit SecD, partial [Planctomycetaceae bacterium]|nr:protein translocase subunit SecD [Planctomycetaceae bacterium]
MHLLANSIISKLSLFAQADAAEQGGTGGVLLFVVAILIAILVNVGKDNAVSAGVKRSFNVTDPNWGMMFGLFVFGLLLGLLPYLFLLISESSLSENAVSGFRVSGLMVALFSGLYLAFRVFCESSKVREPEQAWRLAVVVAVTILGALYIGVKHGDDETVSKKFKLGVDLAGGVNLVYQIQPEVDDNGNDKDMTDADMQGLLNALGRRLNPSGALDLILRPYGTNTHVEIVVPEATPAEIANIKEVITNTGALEFMIQVDATESDAEHADIRKTVEDSFTSTYNTRLVRNDQGDVIGRWVKVGTTGDVEKETLEFSYNASSAGSIKRVFYRDDLGNDVEAPVLLTSGQTIHFDSANAEHRKIKDVFDDAGGARSAKEFSDIVAPAGVTRVEILMIQPEENVRTTGDDLKSVRSTYDGSMRPSVAFSMNATSAGKFGRFTGQNINEQLSIVLDGNLLSSANINSRISESGVIEGDFTQTRVDQIIGILRAGSLPGTLNPNPESENKMGASLGTATIVKGTNAIIWSMVIVLFFMIGWYFGVPGFVAAFALLLNLVLILAVMVMIGASFTLSGMAGLVLTVGMAVDANVLIFERIREELADGARVKAAIRNGFSRATITIIDANLTTMITAILLYAIGTDQIRGFAITLILGIIMSMFTAIYASRGIFVVAAGLKWISEKSWSLRPFNSRSISFMSKTKVTAVVSVIVIAVGLTVTFKRQSELLAIDLSGGTSAIFELSADQQDAGEIEQMIREHVEGEDFERTNEDGSTQAFQFSVTSVDLEAQDGATRAGWRVNTNLIEQADLESLLGDIFTGQLQQQTVSVEILSSTAEESSETQSSAVIRSLPQFVSYQEETPVEETPVEETPVEETPVEETPVEETPV